MPLRFSLAMTAILALAACSDSDGTSGPSTPAGGGSGPVTVDPLNLPDTGTVEQIEGEGVSGNQTRGFGGGVESPEAAAATLGTEGGDITQITASIQALTMSVDTLNSSVTPAPAGVVFEDPDQDSLNGTLRTGILSVDGLETAPLEYMVYGAWSVQDTSAVPVRFAAVHAGNRTPAGNMPTSGNATYTGSAVGVLADDLGSTGGGVIRADYTAALQVSTSDFESFSFTTSDTEIDGSARNDLDLIGTLNRTGNGLTGDISAPLSTRVESGQATARFYGPNADELGGVYSVTNGVLGNIAASFGASRDPQFSPLN